MRKGYQGRIQDINKNKLDFGGDGLKEITKNARKFLKRNSSKLIRGRLKRAIKKEEELC